MNCTEASKKWGVSKVRVYQWLKEGRISNVSTIDGHPDIPDNTERPEPRLPGRKLKIHSNTNL